MASNDTGRDGVIQDETTGEYYIPATRRPDGTWRKPRKVKDGYIPQEEVATYENKGVTWMKSKPSLPPGLNPDVTAADAKPVAVASDQYEGMSKAAKKNAKRKEKKKQQQPSGVNNLSTELANTKLSSDSSEKFVPDQSGEGDANDRLGLEKRLRNLQKKLKQIEQLQKRIESGDLPNPEKDQLEKISKKKEIESEIEDIQLDLATM